MMAGSITFTKPLSLNDKLLIETVTTRYEGVAAQWVSFDRGDHIELMVPEKIVRSAPWGGKASSAR